MFGAFVVGQLQSMPTEERLVMQRVAFPDPSLGIKSNKLVKASEKLSAAICAQTSGWRGELTTDTGEESTRERGSYEEGHINFRKQ